MSNMWQETPLIYSDTLSNILDASVYLKLENLQPCHSFKLRGISHFVKWAKDTNGPSLHAVIASGGNAGLAAACAANGLDVKCTVYLPVGASETTLRLLRQQKASVVVTGAFYSETLSAAKQVLEKDQNAVMIPAYDDPKVWEGHATIITEISKQMSVRPDAVFCSVGGGGLLGGLIVGCQLTIGSDCFYHSMSLNNGRFNSTSKLLPPTVDLVFDDAHEVYLARFNSFSSKASGSLGASEPAAKVVKMALERTGGTKCVSISDEFSMQACLNFADDHKMLVELACSTTLVPAYNPGLFNRLVPRSGCRNLRPVVVFVVCGGFKTSMSDLHDFKRHLENNMAKETDDLVVKYDDGQVSAGIV
ncbi:hypothetical protein M378DRAFT_191015 [Amanita muscaria Koide BX008]|uniref:L-serine ammonia-lyase n=1 Tax=Amanita muscaria (strain Koide BX008) TaxID=946122 RepID=A0A0C2X3A2_AMAMK|nr:hypothetical protein M378DRAFT_191015 [Amanita muscaria Koide BX008]